jgi:pimeloyl-ACP methyl ester carboxylesterase
MWGWSAHFHLPGLRMPALVLHDAGDPLVPIVNDRYMARIIPPL